MPPPRRMPFWSVTIGSCVVALHPDPGLAQVADRPLDVGDVDVQDREGRRLVVGLRVDEDRRAARAVDLEDAGLLAIANVQPERRAVEAPRLVGVLDGEAAEDRAVLEHGRASFRWAQVAPTRDCSDLMRRGADRISPSRRPGHKSVTTSGWSGFELQTGSGPTSHSVSKRERPVDGGQPQLARPAVDEAVRLAGRTDDDVARLDDRRRIADPERRLTRLDDEDLGVRVAMELRARRPARRGRG